MDLSRPLASLLPAAEAGALSVLAGTQAPLTGRRVAALAGESSHPSTLRALNRLVEQGLVHVEVAGRANLYRLNRDHLLAAAVLELADSGAALQRRLAAAIGGWRVPCLHAALFGSVARGQATPASDVDVLVVRPEGLSAEEHLIWDAQLAELEAKAHAWTGNSLSWLETTMPDVRRAHDAGEPILQSWRDDAVQLAGRPLMTLLRGDPAVRSAVSR